MGVVQLWTPWTFSLYPYMWDYKLHIEISLRMGL